MGDYIRLKPWVWFYIQAIISVDLCEKSAPVMSNTEKRMSWNYIHDDVIKWKHFPRYWPFVRGIHRSPLNSPHKGQWRRALVFSLIYAWINCWANNREAGDLRRYRVHYDVTVMWMWIPAKRPVTRSFDVFFDLRLSKRLNKQSSGWWFETLSCPLWRHCNVEDPVIRKHWK